jgi:hypothetical protein
VAANLIPAAENFFAPRIVSPLLKTDQSRSTRRAM